MDPAVERFVPIVDFLGRALGRNAEIALHDFSDPEHSLVAIANGHISGRSVGAPATDFALKILNDYAPERGDVVAGYISYSVDNRPLRSASYIIRGENRTAGMLCINVDVSQLELLEHLAHDILEGYAPANDQERSRSTSERLTSSSDDLVRNVVQAHALERGKPVEKLDQTDRIDIVRQLNDNGVFLLKGAVAEVAQAMGISEPSVYRYLQKVKREG